MLVIRPLDKRPRLIVPGRPVPKVSMVDPDKSNDEKTKLLIDQITAEAWTLESAELRALWLDGIETFKKTGDTKSLIELTQYRRKIVPLDEFFFGKAYLNQNPAEIYPGVVKACEALDKDQYLEAVLMGGLGTGKSTIANLMVARTIYKFSCMRHPQATFGIRAQSSLLITIQSIRLATARKAVFDEFGSYIKNSPYFKYIYPFDKLISTQMIFREQNLTVMPVASSNTGAISMNVIAGILDEMNFMQRIQKSKSQHAEDDGSFHQAKQTYLAISRRRESRFLKQGKLPGLLFLISSSRFPNDFTQQRAAESAMFGGTNDKIYVYNESVWSAKAPGTYSEQTFRVMIGDTHRKSRVLTPAEVVDEGCRTIDVPMDFYLQFTQDTDGALRDFAGETILATRPFITKREAIYEAMQKGTDNGFENPYESETYNLALGIPKPDRNKLRTDIPIFRAAHLDLASTRDACGLAIGHIHGEMLIDRTDPVTGLVRRQLMPMIAYDVLMRITPPPNGEIEFASVREILVMLRDQYGLPIEFVTVDGFQSIDCRQILRQLGFKTDYLSVDKKVDEYRSFRDALYDGRILMPPYNYIANELAGLEYTTTPSKKEKVDHRADGTKDVADAACGVSALLFTRRLAWSGLLTKVDKQGSRVELPPIDKDKQAINIVQPAKVRPVSARKSVVRRSVFRRP